MYISKKGFSYHVCNAILDFFCDIFWSVFTTPFRFMAKKKDLTLKKKKEFI